MIKHYLYAFVRRLYYYLFVIKARRAYSIKTLRKRLKIAGVEIEPVSKLQWVEIKQRFKGFKLKKKWFDYYNTVYKTLHADKGFDVTKVVPGMVFYPYIDSLFAHPIEARTTSDKNFCDLLFYDIRRPLNIVRFQDGIFMDEHYNVITREDAYNRIRLANDVVIKPSWLSGAGRGIVFWNGEKDAENIFDELFVKGRYYVVQEVVKQHSCMCELYANSVNTIRMETFLWKNEVQLLSCAVRMGANGSKVDNLSDGGGMSCGVDLKNGMLSPQAYDYYHINITYDKHPQGCRFEGFVIPSWDKCVAAVKKLAPRFGRVSKLIAWDLAVAEDGEPILIECNMMDSGCEILQLNNGPLFGDQTDEVLDYVRKNKRKRF